MNVVHLTDSPFFGGPERQMLGLARNLSGDIQTLVLCFRDHASACPFLAQLAESGISARMLRHGNPRFARVVRELTNVLRDEKADLLICHGYKADVLGWMAARLAGIPVISVSRGWTGHTRKVRLYEALDRQVLRWMDAVVCVSEGQAEKVRRAGVAGGRVVVIHNAIDVSRFGEVDRKQASRLRGFIRAPLDRVVLAIGRLSPEKGFEQLVESARLVVRERPGTGFVLVGDGPERADLQNRVARAGLEDHFVFTGFRSDVDELLPHADVLVQSSYTEGLPNVLLEASAAGVPVVATSVGGTPEVVEDGLTGFLVPSGDPQTMATRVIELLDSPGTAAAMGQRGRSHVRARFSFGHQGKQYRALLERVVATRSTRQRARP